MIDLSRKRKRLNKLFMELEGLRQIFMERGPMINGGVYKNMYKCNNPNCVCRREGKLHIAWRYYYTERGKNKIRTLRREEVLRYQELTNRYKRFRRARARFVKINKEILKILNDIEDGLIEMGRGEI